MSNTPIELKGSSFTLSVVHLHDANPEVIRQALEDKIAQAPAFLRHAPVVVNIASIEEEVEWRAINEAIAATGILLAIARIAGETAPLLQARLAQLPADKRWLVTSDVWAPSASTSTGICPSGLLVRSQKRV